jgi:hypothetical protein
MSCSTSHAASASASDVTGSPVSRSASKALGVTVAARGRMASRYSGTSSAGRNSLPLSPITGSHTGVQGTPGFEETRRVENTQCEQVEK